LMRMGLATAMSVINDECRTAFFLITDSLNPNEKIAYQKWRRPE